MKQHRDDAEDTTSRETFEDMATQIASRSTAGIRPNEPFRDTEASVGRNEILSTDRRLGTENRP